MAGHKTELMSLKIACSKCDCGVEMMAVSHHPEIMFTAEYTVYQCTRCGAKKKAVYQEATFVSGNKIRIQDLR